MKRGPNVVPAAALLLHPLLLVFEAATGLQTKSHIVPLVQEAKRMPFGQLLWQRAYLERFDIQS